MEVAKPPYILNLDSRRKQGFRFTFLSFDFRWKR